MHWPILILSLLIVSSCGKSDSNAGMPKGLGTPAPATNEVIPHKKYFLANLVALNPATTGSVAGRFTVVQTGTTFQGKMSLSTSSWHMDNIHAGSRCPTMTDDTNGDMVIDTSEAENVAGKILVDLNDRARTTYFKGAHDLANKVVLIKTSTEALACGILKVVSELPSETGYGPQPRPTPTPTPTPEPQPEPRPTPEPEDDEDEDEDEDGDSWSDRWNDWWRCRLGGCD